MVCLETQLAMAARARRARAVGGGGSTSGANRSITVAIDTHSQGLTTVGVRTPEQVRVLTIGDEEPLVNYAKSIVSELCHWRFRQRPDESQDRQRRAGQSTRCR